MSQLIIVTTPQNSGLGTPLATSFDYCNSNFTELYLRAQTSPPATLVGKSGDVPGMYAYDSTYFYYCFAQYNGSSTIWGQVSQVANILIPEIQNGLSNVAISTLNSNVTVGVNGTSNVAVFATTGTYLKGVVSTTGNVTGAYILGNGSQLTGLPATYNNANVATFLSAFGSNTISTTGSIISGSLTTPGSVNATGTVTGGAFTTGSTVSATGTISGSAFNTGGQVSAAGNIVTDRYFIGDGSKLTNVSGGSANANAIVNGLTSVTIPAISGNVAVTVGFASNVMVVSPNGITVAGTVATNTITATNTVSATGNVTGGNVNTIGQVSATGNISGNYILGNGALLTGLVISTTYSNANVAAYLPTYSGNITAGNISVTGNVTGNVTGVVTGQLNGLVNGVNTNYGAWDFGYIAANTYTNPLQWIFAQTSLGNIDMGTVSAPASYAIDIGTIF